MGIEVMVDGSDWDVSKAGAFFLEQMSEYVAQCLQTLVREGIDPNAITVVREGLLPLAPIVVLADGKPRFRVVVECWKEGDKNLAAVLVQEPTHASE